MNKQPKRVDCVRWSPAGRLHNKSVVRQLLYVVRLPTTVQGPKTKANDTDFSVDTETAYTCSVQDGLFGTHCATTSLV